MIERKLIIDAITSSTREVFTTLLSEPPPVGDSYAEHNLSCVADGLVSLVGLTGEWIGTAVVTCGATLACQLSAMLLLADVIPAKETKVDEEVLDSLAEITNMIVGNVKSSLEDEIGELKLSIPAVVYGKNLTARSPTEGDWVVVPFDCRGQRLEVRLCLLPGNGQSTLRPLEPTQTAANAGHHNV